MPLIERAEGRTLFGAEARRYARARPDYPARVREVLLARCGAIPGARAFEIGAGTGKATRVLLELGCEVSAVEPDARMSAVLLEDLSPSLTAHLQVMNCGFEEAPLEAASFDLGIAATAFHWLEPAVVLPRIFDLLRPGGHWAMWWNLFDPPEDDAFLRRTAPLFESLARGPSQAPNGRPTFALDVAARTAELHAAGFEAVQYERLDWEIEQDTESVLALVATFSPVSHASPEAREVLMQGLRRITDEEFGGRVTRCFQTTIYTAVRL
ncbi:class I SAM-dependent methyltransferase [Niveibacterium sp. SC-1]|uniref:class I SAM-dependent methyltransferase n=1 Tax=Niveibacterium sp. SC-1 TaxID=3135646 RepID=UPI00311EB3A7